MQLPSALRRQKSRRGVAMPVPRKGHTWFCLSCGVGYAPGRSVLPLECPECRAAARDEDPLTLWTVVPPWKLSTNDKRFLRSLRIAGD